MLSFPNCKINLGLNILQKREDGFHDLETVFYPLPLKDMLEIISASAAGEELSYADSGLPVGGAKENNLCCKAYQLLKKDFPLLPRIKLHLHKGIPTGAGLGGGSADAAFTLQLLNDLFQLNISTAQLLRYAVVLGSDSPFFIINKPCLAKGRGELLEEIALNLSVYSIILINPGVHINTAWAFSQVSPALPEKNISSIIHQSISTWKEELKNDFEQPVFEKYPEIKNIKEELYNQGALYASMSGSGSTVYGIFNSTPPENLFRGKEYFIKLINKH
jgi:4-diphosphocytidyl-2-C-methyl-D-erythritol kinase